MIEERLEGLLLLSNHCELRPSIDAVITKIAFYENNTNIRLVTDKFSRRIERENIREFRETTIRAIKRAIAVILEYIKILMN